MFCCNKASANGFPCFCFLLLGYKLALQAQRHKDAGLKALDQGKLKAQEHAQLAADMANRKAAELAHNVSFHPLP